MICNLLLVDDHALIRAGIRALVSDIPGYQVIGEACDGNQLLEMTLALKPDIILLDISMKDSNGLDALERLHHALPDSKVLILSMHTEPQMIMRALEGGAHGYLLKDATATEIEQALEGFPTDGFGGRVEVQYIGSKKLDPDGWGRVVGRLEAVGFTDIALPTRKSVKLEV